MGSGFLEEYLFDIIIGIRGSRIYFKENFLLFNDVNIYIRKIIGLMCFV